MLVRNTPKGERVKEEIITQTGNKNILVIRCDVSDMQTVREAAGELKEKLFGINILINKASSAFSEKQFSRDGYEMTFALNHQKQKKKTQNQMPLLQRGQARIINF